MIAAKLINAHVRLGTREALRDVSVAIAPGERVALIGPNGAGKSTALRALLGLTPLASGQARLGDRPAHARSAGERGRCASYLPQRREAAWAMPARDLVALGLYAWGAGRGFTQLSPDHRRAVAAALEKADAGHLAERPLDQLSGGEEARVHLARALVSKAGLLIADEPVAELDLRQQMDTMDVLAGEAAAGRAVVISTHDLAAAQTWADRIVVLHRGALIVDDAPSAALDETVLREVFGLKRGASGGLQRA